MFTVHTGCRGLEVRPDGILCEKADGTKEAGSRYDRGMCPGAALPEEYGGFLRDAAPYVLA